MGFQILNTANFKTARAKRQLRLLDLPEWGSSIIIRNIHPMDLVLAGTLPKPITDAISEMLDDTVKVKKDETTIQRLRRSTDGVHAVVCAVVLQPDAFINAAIAAAEADYARNDDTEKATQLVEASLHNHPNPDGLLPLLVGTLDLPGPDQFPVTDMPWADRVYIWQALMGASAAFRGDTEDPETAALELVPPRS